MRIVDLDLERFGPFTAKRLAFRPDARLHIVFGVNEAGKSCSLAAVTDLLFGIERSTRYGFVHAGKDLRLGATLRDRSGRDLTFRRRKTKPLLTDADDAPLPDDVLAPYLGGLSREVFRRAFGLDAEALRLSGQELKESDGELGAALFSAASGLRGFGDARLAMEKDADAIFAERRSQNRLFYQAHDRYEAARARLRERETRAGALKAIRETLADSEARLVAIRERKAEIDVERARLERLRRAAPILRDIDADADRLAGLGALPDAPEGFGATLMDSLAARAAALATLETAEATERRLRAECDSVAVDPALLGQSDAIEALHAASGEYRKGLQDLPGVMREEASVNRTLADLAVRLRLADAAALLANRPDDASAARVADLVAQGERLALALESRREAQRRERAALADKQAERNRRGGLVDPRRFRERLGALDGVRSLAERLDAELPALERDGAALAEAAARLDPPVRDLDALAGSPLPTAERIAATLDALKRLDEAERRERQALDAAMADLDRLSGELAALAAGGEVPTRDRIAALRDERDAHWAALSGALFGRPDAPAGQDLAAATASFERAKAEADRLADAAFADAERVAAHADVLRNQRRRSEAAEAARARLEAIAADRERAGAEWTEAWSACGITPLAPALMGNWRLQLDNLLQQREQHRRKRSDAGAASARIDAGRAAMDALAADLDLPVMPGLAVTDLLRRLDAEVARLAEAWDLGRDSDALVLDLQRRVEAADAAAVAAEEAQAAWREDFQTALPRIGLPPDASRSEAQAVLQAWRDVPAASSEAEKLQRRIAGLKRDAEAFTTAMRALAHSIAPDLAAGDPDQVLSAVKRRLGEARTADALRREKSRRVEEAREARLAAALGREAADRAAAALASQAGLDPAGDLQDAATRLARRDAIATEIDRRRRELANAADGRDEASLRDALATYDPERADGDAARLAAESETLDLEGKQAFAARQSAAEKLAALEGSVDAELALQQRRSAEAEMLEAGREWAVLSVGALMIETAIKRQRVGRQEPMMARAGELFALMTGGAYQGLGQVYDEDDAPHLVGRRASGSEVAVAEMSEGTRDQLYLALRLAYVEDYAVRAEPAPFLCDDLFSSFDDRRTAFGLKALAEIGGSVQPILFTHHGFVVDAAQRELGADADVIELG
ncbi:AAA family ATPase [Alsobacter sp. KACC 23698]|uniref:AAA family ATPase n=1 Tax=Alsobacter sp. KACC 23698 TaxID=3149229 RepID=A0AAU7JLT6_9HYPH